MAVGGLVLTILAGCAGPLVTAQPAGTIVVPDDPGPAIPAYAEQRTGSLHATLTGQVSGVFAGTVGCSRTTAADGSTLLTYNLALAAKSPITAQLEYKPASGWAAGFLTDGAAQTGSYALTGATTLALPADLSGGQMAVAFAPMSGAAGSVNLQATLTCPASSAKRSVPPATPTAAPTYVASQPGYYAITASGVDPLEVTHSQYAVVTCSVAARPDGTWYATYRGEAPYGSDQVWIQANRNLATGQFSGQILDQRDPTDQVTLTLDSTGTIAVAHDQMSIVVVTGYSVTSGTPQPQPTTTPVTAATPTSGPTLATPLAGVTPSATPTLVGNEISLSINCEPQSAGASTQTPSPGVTSATPASLTPTPMTPTSPTPTSPTPTSLTPTSATPTPASPTPQS